jgi:hypothetical protein
VPSATQMVELDQTHNGLLEWQKRAETRATDARVVSEPRCYGPDSPYSHYQDLGVVTVSRQAGTTPTSQGASERMAAYERELAFEVERGSKEGRRAERIVREQARSRADEREDRHRELSARSFVRWPREAA